MEILFHVQILHEKFMKRFSKCTFKSVTDEQFDLRGGGRLLANLMRKRMNEFSHCMRSAKKRIPAYMTGNFMDRISRTQWSESISTFFGKYIHKKMKLKEFYEAIWNDSV